MWLHFCFDLVLCIYKYHDVHRDKQFIYALKVDEYLPVKNYLSNLFSRESAEL